MSVLVDNQVVCECHDIFSAVCAMFACYHVFDIHFAPSLSKVMLFLNSHVLSIEKQFCYFVKFLYSLAVVNITGTNSAAEALALKLLPNWEAENNLN